MRKRDELMEEYRAVAKLADGPRWQAVMDDLEDRTADALIRRLRPL